jgi:hypothetical protein
MQRDKTHMTQTTGTTRKSLKEYLYPGATTRFIMHTMVWFDGSRHPRQADRDPNYRSNDPKEVREQCKYLEECGVDVLMYNWYGPGTFEDEATQVYFKESPLNHIINIDGGAFGSQAELNDCVEYIRYHYLSHPLYEQWRGKYVITFFAKDANDPAWFRSLEANNPDIIFVYNATKWGASQMDWVDSALEHGIEGFCNTYKNRDDGLFIPYVSPGFDDTHDGHSVWYPDKPPRVWPEGVGPNWDTLIACFDTINRHYSESNQLEYVQGVTLNDVEEGSNLEADFLVTESGDSGPETGAGSSSLHFFLDGNPFHEQMPLPQGGKVLLIEQRADADGAVLGSVAMGLE